MAINLFQEAKKLVKANASERKLKRTRYEDVSSYDQFITLSDLVEPEISNEHIISGINVLSNRMRGKVFTKKDFGRIGWIKLGKILSNIDIQRLLEAQHIGKNILPFFDPRIVMPVNVIYYKDTDTYTCWDGQQTASTILLLVVHGLVDADNWEDFEVKANIIDADLEVPGSLVGGAEAIANFGFRTHNGPIGKKRVSPYFVMRSECNGAKLYHSKLMEDMQSRLMWDAMVSHDMFPADKGPKGDSGKPGHISHISGMKKMAGHGKDTFDVKTFEKSIEFLSKHFIEDAGINASFYMAIAYLFNLLKEQKIAVGTTAKCFNEERFAEFLKETYGRINTSDAFRAYAGARYKLERKAMGYAGGWSDDCTLPYMIEDYIEYCEVHGLTTGKLPVVKKLSEFSKDGEIGDDQETDE